jgi:hypothetical protein
MPPKCEFLQEPHGVMSQKTAFFARNLFLFSTEGVKSREDKCINILGVGPTLRTKSGLVTSTRLFRLRSTADRPDVIWTTGSRGSTSLDLTPFYHV